MDSEQLTKIISDWNSDKLKSDMETAEKYYLSDNDINSRKFEYFILGGRKNIDIYRSNEKISNSFFPLLVDQKVSYCLSKNITFDIDTVFDINSEISDTAEEASIKSVGWCHVYIDSEGLYKLKTMSSQDIIPLYDGTIENKLETIIRLYKQNDDEMAEVFDAFNKEIWKKDKDGNYQKQETTTHLNDNVSWGLVPFVPIYNNRFGISDLTRIKCLIDSYDKVISDFSNNFIDFQELILLVRGYNENVNTPEAAVELMEWLKKYKIINVRKDGGIDIISQEVPYQARGEFLSILKKLIFTFGQGVDIDDLSGGSLTNVVIEAHFSLLDMKANKFIRQLVKFIKELLKFSNKINEFKNIAIFDINKVNITFNKSLIINEKEVIESLSTAVGGEKVMSQETAVQKNPYVDNSAEEMLKIDEENIQYQNDIVPGNEVDLNDTE
jgi:SPP1 family phage portal protein